MYKHGLPSFVISLVVITSLMNSTCTYFGKSLFSTQSGNFKGSVSRQTPWKKMGFEFIIITNLKMYKSFYVDIFICTINEIHLMYNPKCTSCSQSYLLFIIF